MLFGGRVEFSADTFAWSKEVRQAKALPLLSLRSPKHAAARGGRSRRWGRQERLDEVSERGDVDEKVQVADGAALAGGVGADQAPRRVAVDHVRGGGGPGQQ